MYKRQAFIYGLPEMKVDYVEFENVAVMYDDNPEPDEPAMMDDIELVAKMGVFVNNVQRLKLKNVTVEAVSYTHLDVYKRQDLGNGISRAEMLPGMVDGVHTWKCQIKAGTVVTLETFADQTQIYYFTKGEGFVETPKKAFNIEEPSLFIPNMDKETNVLHAVTDMEFLQLTCVMLPEDYEQFSHWHIALPRFCPLSGCIEYIEGFRPEGIKAYSILDTHFLTRMTMGAIIGKGPNKADPHSHNNLYPVSYTHLIQE